MNTPRQILLLDNYDSFIYNISHYLQMLGATVTVRRNDVPLPKLVALNSDALVISPGPGTPDQPGVMLEAIAHFAPTTPILGVCLGHQAIGQTFGWTVQRAAIPMHGKASLIYHRAEGILAGLPNPFLAGRYHSLVVVPSGNATELECLAHTQEGEVMAIRHRQLPIVGVQFHPESYLTDACHGLQLLRNFLDGKY